MMTARMKMDDREEEKDNRDKGKGQKRGLKG